MEFVFDIETSGLPRIPKVGTKRKAPEPSDLEAYESARIVSIAWFLVEPASKTIVQQEYYLIKPEDFSIPESATRIHGITDTFAKTHGIPITSIFEPLNTALKRTSNIVSYNINFDYKVLKSELIRNEQAPIVEELASKQQLCAMLMSQKHLKTSHFPKLSHAYESIIGKPIQGAHNAHGDTQSCYEIYEKLCKNNS
jgi:DNA polymerase III epsilon subunit-like protein